MTGRRIAVMNQDQIQALLDQLASYALDAVGALVILLVGWWIAGRTQYLVRRALDRVPRIDDTLKPFLSSSVRVRYAFIRAESATSSIRRLCDLFDVHPSGYYA